jgi:hypothetical protein
MKNREIERRYLEEDWALLKRARNRAKNGKLPRYMLHALYFAAKIKAQKKAMNNDWPIDRSCDD